MDELLDRVRRVDGRFVARSPVMLAVPLCLSVSLWLLWPILSAESWYVSNQSYRYPYLLSMFAEQWRQGIWYPRWLPGLAGGYGYPTFVYYPPGFWFVATLMLNFTADVVAACKGTMLIFMVVGGLGAFQLARCFGNAVPAIVSAALFLLTPYLCVNLYARGDLAEAAAMLIAPWALYHQVRIGRDVKRGMTPVASPLWLGVSLAAVVVTHSTVGAWLSLVLVVFSIGIAWDSGRFWQTLLPSIIAGALAAALSAPYWLPAMTMIDLVGHERALGAGKSLPLSKLLSFQTDLRPINGRRGSEALGPILPVLALVGFLLASIRPERRGTALAGLSCLVGMVWYLTPSFPNVHEWFPQLYYLQGKYRSMSALATVETCGVAMGLSWMWGVPPRRWLAVVMLAFALAIGWSEAPRYYVKKALDFEQFERRSRNTFTTMTHVNEFRPRGADWRGLPLRRSAAAIVEPSPLVKVQSAHKGPGPRFVVKVVAEQPGAMVLNQFDFPGWQVSVDGVLVARCAVDALTPTIDSYCADERGRLSVYLPHAGKHTVKVIYDGAPGSLLRNTLAGLVVLGGVATLSLRRLRNRRGHRPAQNVTKADGC